MFFRRLTIPCAAAGAIATAACSNAPPRAAASPQRAGVAVRSNWQAVVRVEQTDSSVVTLPSGDRQRQQTIRRAQFTLTVGPDAHTTARLDNLAIVPNGATAPIGTTWTARWPGSNAPGVSTDAADDDVGALTAMVRDLLPRLPDEVVRPGMQWTDSTTGPIEPAPGLTATERRSTHWASDQFTVWNGRRTLPITSRGEYERIGKGTVDKAAASLTTQGRSICKYYLTANGELASATCDDSLGSMISIPSERRLIPSLRHVTTTMRFIAGDQ
jgi:hypothetical protein